MGYPSEGLFNFLALLGWTHPEAKEILSREELIRDFQVERLSKSPSKFDVNKMNWFAKEYMKKTPNAEISKQLNIIDKSKEWIELFIETFKQSSATISEIKDHFNIYLDTSVKNIDKNEVVKEFAIQLENQPFTPEGIQLAINVTKEKTKVSGKNLFLPIRVATTYVEHGPELAKAIYLVGEKLVKERLK